MATSGDILLATREDFYMATDKPIRMCKNPYLQSEFAGGGEYASDEICGVTP